MTGANEDVNSKCNIIWNTILPQKVSAKVNAKPLQILSEAPEKVKKAWLDKHLHSVTFDNIILTEYGVSKREIMKNSRGILFDDNEKVRADWNGISFSEKDILEILKTLVR